MDVNTNLNNETLIIYNSLNSFLTSPIVFITILVILVLYFVFSLSLGKSSDDNLLNTNDSDGESFAFSGTIFYLALFVFIVVILINLTKYYINYDIFASLQNVIWGNPEIVIKAIQQDHDRLNTPVPEIILKKQVFHIPENTYTYGDAKALCTAYGGDLATYSQLEEAYNNNMDFCGYGWSEGQMILYPTQKETYDKLQTIKGHEQDCGRPGINGGFIANPHLRFGANCYGYKPRITGEELELMAKQELYPKTKEEIALEKRVDYWKTQLDSILVSPFNSELWSKF
jgi:hypothetical protein